MKKLISIAALGAFCLCLQPALAEDVKEIFARVEALMAQKNYPKAIEELSWAKKEIEKLNTAQLQTFFPDTLAGFSGDALESQNMFGISNIERTYRNSGGKGTVKVSVTGGSGSGSPLAGLAGLGSVAAMMQGQGSGNDVFRIDGRTANLSENKGSKTSELTVFLNSGSILKLEGSGLDSSDTLKNMAQALKLNDLDNYLRGAS